jgi:large subunit ribosomal protein L14
MLKYKYEMIQQQTKLKSADNSGAKNLKCIKIFGGLKKETSLLGDIVLVSVKELRNKSKVSSKVLKGDVAKAVLIRTKRKNFKKDGSNFLFANNSVVLTGSNNKLIGTRIFGPVPKFLRKHKVLKLASVSTGFL